MSLKVGIRMPGLIIVVENREILNLDPGASAGEPRRAAFQSWAGGVETVGWIRPFRRQDFGCRQTRDSGACATLFRQYDQV
jgi:hypothetical protein